MTRIVTWNMEGANWGSGNSPWNVLAQFLDNGSADIVCIQEAGLFPSSASNLPFPNFVGDALPPVFLYHVFYGIWNKTSRNPGYIVFWLFNASGGRRVNLALMCRGNDPPNNLVYVKPAPFGDARPAIGFNHGAKYFMSTHALSGGGGDATTILRYATNPFPVGTSAYIFGDYNCEPVPLAGRIVAAGPGYPLTQNHICPPNNITRPKSMKYFDYAVRLDAPTPVIGDVSTDYDHMSDHRPVFFDF